MLGNPAGVYRLNAGRFSLSRRLLILCLVALLAWLPVGGVLHAALAHGGTTQLDGKTVKADEAGDGPCAVCLVWAACAQILPGSHAGLAPLALSVQALPGLAPVAAVSLPPVPQSRGPPSFLKFAV